MAGNIMPKKAGNKIKTPNETRKHIQLRVPPKMFNDISKKLIDRGEKWQEMLMRLVKKEFKIK